MKVLVVGEAGVQPVLHNMPPGGAGWRLQRILGLDSVAYLELDRENLCGETWSAPHARLRAHVLATGPSPYEVIIVLGARARGAFARALHCEIDEWQMHRIRRGARRYLSLIAIPPTEGPDCRAWADLSRAPRLRAELTNVAPGIPWGIAVPPEPKEKLSWPMPW